MIINNPVGLFLFPLFWYFSSTLTWMPSRGSSLGRSDDARNLKRLLVSAFLSMSISTLVVFIVFVMTYHVFSGVLSLPLSLPGGRDQSLLISTLAGSPPSSAPDTFGPSAARTHQHWGGEWEAGQRAQRGENEAVMINQIVLVLSSERHLRGMMCAFLNRCPGTETVFGLSWPSSVSTGESWPGHTHSRLHRWLEARRLP